MKESRPEKGRELMRISRVAEAAGVSVQTIHYYLREGLLTPPVKTARNMAYYNTVCIEEIRLIKELQLKRYLPLSVIKLVLKAKRDGQGAGHVAEMSSFLDEMFHPLEMELETTQLSLVELAAATGLSPVTLRELGAMGLLLPDNEPDEKHYDGMDVRIGQTVKDLLDLGLTLSDLSPYQKYVETIRYEAMTMHDRVFHRLHESGEFPIAEIVKSLNSLKLYLATKVYRKAAMEHRA